MVTVYKKSTGQPVLVAHLIDAKEYVRGGAYSWDNPTIKPEMPVRSVAKPTVIPTVEDKKSAKIPIVEELDVVEPEDKMDGYSIPVKIDKPVIPKRIIRK